MGLDQVQQNGHKDFWKSVKNMFEKIFLKECTELNHDQQFKIKIFIVFQMCAKLKKKSF